MPPSPVAAAVGHSADHATDIQVTGAGVIVGLAGTGRADLPVRGAPGQAELTGPSAVALDSDGELLLVHTVNQRIRELMPPFTFHGRATIASDLPT